MTATRVPLSDAGTVLKWCGIGSFVALVITAVAGVPIVPYLFLFVTVGCYIAVASLDARVRRVRREQERQPSGS